MMSPARVLVLKRELITTYAARGWPIPKYFRALTPVAGPWTRAMVRRVQGTILNYQTPTGQFDARTQAFLDGVNTCPKPPFVTKASVPTHGTRVPKYIVIHMTEGGGTVESLGAYFTNAGAGLGVNFANEASGRIGQYCAVDDETWHVVAHNSECLGIEQIGQEHSRDEWMTTYLDQLHSTAWWLAWITQTLDIPIRRAAQNRQWIAPSGVCQHLDVPDNDHTDCGAGYPFDLVLDLARQYRYGGPAPDFQKKLQGLV